MAATHAKASSTSSTPAQRTFVLDTSVLLSDPHAMMRKLEERCAYDSLRGLAGGVADDEDLVPVHRGDLSTTAQRFATLASA